MLKNLFPVLFLLLSFQAYGQTLRELLSEPTPIICSHRGVIHPDKVENSLSSMEESLQAGIKMHEIDIMETKDGELYILHDKTLDRTTNLQGKISEKTAQELRQGKLLNTEESIPSFKDALNWAKENDALLMLDAKEAPVQTIMDAVKAAEMMEKVMILTFSRERAAEAFDYDQPYYVSVLITSEEDISYYQELATDPSYMIAYINKAADLELYNKVLEADVPIVTDTMGELDLAAYEEGLQVFREFYEQRKPSIIVSDYPLLVQEAILK
ncbi:glycerophosphodiester phosphodiesterase family protein [Litoribacter ruber]|uniref:glycerophosphodiester phosphodiesterase family protein n=1 Tax=Litoribacter ruber TaxID=702568 RepID=UPI001BD9DA90|nr:glycerophosphodiester phosphodiesterase family protein [Litoribacter ruber]MBT0810041.1 glycerophosphodiester phosphodiesterase family protein [Litoribacter ruber]